MKKFLKIIKYGFLLLFTIVLAVNIYYKFDILQTNYSGILPILNESSQELDDVLVIPLYGTSFGFWGGGADGPIFNIRSKSKYAISDLYRMNSGNGIFSKEVKSHKSFFWPPIPIMMGIGQFSSYKSSILIKKGYQPKLFISSDYNMEYKAVMSASTSDEENKRILAALLDYKNNQAYLKKLFGAEDLVKEQITTDFGEKDLALLKKYLN